MYYIDVICHKNKDLFFSGGMPYQCNKLMCKWIAIREDILTGEDQKCLQ